MRAHIDTGYGNLGGNAEFFVPDMQLCIAGIFFMPENTSGSTVENCVKTIIMKENM
jgi:hypothetical protein